ncbi:EthD family reductase [Trinickia dinghuensis]|uniref:EthD family reductase n=1 Tax=Trinickia dinghuensis TaxID=2291023 RepID=A0A3D8JTU5_9BURK|nr:EthD family reductase [Trinickia dinghuensis]RDU96086.1 EthD family reductase [Trinickia dinghuensis]
MIKVSILYPYRENVRFDFDYYCAKHMKQAAQYFEPALKGWSVDKGISGGEPGSAAAFVAAGHFLFDSVEAFTEVFKPVAAELVADIPNYTDSAPQIVISEVLVNV